MNKEQMFIINEFINKHATKNVWNVSNELIKMSVELLKNNQKELNNNIIMPNNEVGAPS